MKQNNYPNHDLFILIFIYNILMLKIILQLLYKNSHIIRNNNLGVKKIFNNYINQQGGNNNPEKLEIEHKNKIYIFEKSLIDDDNYILYSLDDLECVSILINKPNKVAEIHGIGNYKSCVSTTLTNTNIGSILLKITIKMLKKYKKIFNIKKIILTDNSLKKCNKYNIEFSSMMILLNGHTWLNKSGKYGFRPIDSATYKFDKIKNNKYDNNIKIISTITIKQANLLQFIKLTNKEKLINNVKQLLEKKPDYLLSEYIKSLLANFDITCKYFNMFYKELFDSIGLTNFRGQTFGLEI